MNSSLIRCRRIKTLRAHLVQENINMKLADTLKLRCYTSIASTRKEAIRYSQSCLQEGPPFIRLIPSQHTILRTGRIVAVKSNYLFYQGQCNLRIDSSLSHLHL